MPATLVKPKKTMKTPRQSSSNVGKYLLVSLLFVVTPFLLAAQWTAESVPNVRATDMRLHTVDPDNLLDDASQTQIDQLLTTVEETTTAEIMVVALRSVGDVFIKDFATQLFNYWKIGKADKDNGLLILMVENQYKVSIETGYGMEGILPDAICMRIINNKISPYMMQGKYGEGLLSGVQEVVRLLNDPAAVAEIKADMEKPESMDRLLCGDVGFGKTEVAFRAAFKAIANGKQVAILCPTTLLARQHYERAIERFSNFGVRIAVFSRLITEAQQRKYLMQIESGEANLIIGTHRLLSKDIIFKDLGLLIVDEEQRFGVEQKERIKEIKTNVDVLTLSATPIPRTLQISLLGIRQLSQINTAPINRMPIQTYVMQYREDVIKELIERELSRDGQVFYVHNKVSSIYQVANRLQRKITDAKIGTSTGRWDAKKSRCDDELLCRQFEYSRRDIDY